MGTTSQKKSVVIAHRRCGCPEQYHDRDCAACRGTGLIPPINSEEYFALLHRCEDITTLLNDTRAALSVDPKYAHLRAQIRKTLKATWMQKNG